MADDIEGRIANLEAFKAKVLLWGGAAAVAVLIVFGAEWVRAPRLIADALSSSEVQGTAREATRYSEQAKGASERAAEDAKRAKAAADSLLASIELPIGSIVAWHRDALHQQAAINLPHGWRECNGDTIPLPAGNPLVDANGVFRLPDLNGTPQGYQGGGRFLRGGARSGLLQDGTFLAGITEIGGQSEFYLGNKKSWRPEDPGSNVDAIVNDEQTGRFLYERGQLQSSEERADGYRPRPVNMSVIWIMRVE